MTAPTLEILRQRSAAHQLSLDTKKFLTPQQLADRWGVCPNTVRAIPRVLLPYQNNGTGLVREHRRYDPDDVLAYEAQQKKAG